MVFRLRSHDVGGGHLLALLPVVCGGAADFICGLSCRPCRRITERLEQSLQKVCRFIETLEALCPKEARAQRLLCVHYESQHAPLRCLWLHGHLKCLRASVCSVARGGGGSLREPSKAQHKEHSPNNLIV